MLYIPNELKKHRIHRPALHLKHTSIILPLIYYTRIARILRSKEIAKCIVKSDAFKIIKKLKFIISKI